MTIQASYYVVGVAGNGTTTTFGIPWPFRAPSDLVVQLLDDSPSGGGLPISPPPVLNGGGTYDFVVTGTPDPDTGFYYSGANIVFNHAPLSTHVVWYSRSTLDWQDKVLPSNARFPAKSVEGALDRRTLVDQEQDYRLGGVGAGGGSGASTGRIVQMSPFDLAPFNPVLPSTQGAGGMLLGEKADGSGFQWYTFANGPILGINGFPNQIVASPLAPSGVITLSFPNHIGLGSYAFGAPPLGRIESLYTTNGGEEFRIGNGATGAGATTALAAFEAYTFNGSCSVGLTCPGFTPSGLFVSDMGYVGTSNAGNGLLVVSGAFNTRIRFGIGGYEIARVGQNGVSIGTGTDPAANVPLDILGNLNSYVTGQLVNSNPGTAAGAVWQVGNGSNAIRMIMYGANFAPAAYTNLGTISCDSTAGLALGSAGPVIILPSNAGEVARFTSVGLGIGQAVPPTQLIDARRDQNAVTQFTLTNANTGPASAAVLCLSNGTNAGQLIQFSTGYATAGLNRADGTYLQGRGVGGLTLGATAAAPLMFATSGAECARFDSIGRLCINTTSAGPSNNSQVGIYGGNQVNALAMQFQGASSVGIFIVQTISSSQYLQLYQGNATLVGGITTNGSTTSFLTSSDLRLKKNVRRSTADAGAVIDAIEIDAFDWDIEGIDRHEDFGMVAQKLHKVFPLAVVEGNDETDDDGNLKRPWMYDPAKLVPVLVAEVQSLRKRLDKLTKEKHK